VIEAGAPLARMPLFVREGAILVRLPADVQTLVPRHERMSASVVAIDDRRIVQVWPGRAGSAGTADGITAELSERNTRYTLALSSVEPRRIEVQLVHRRAGSISAAGASVHRAVGATPATIVLPRLQEERTITWTERPVAP
jgi:hypothetical protein